MTFPAEQKTAQMENMKSVMRLPIVVEIHEAQVA